MKKLNSTLKIAITTNIFALAFGCATILPPSDELKAKMLLPEDPALRLRAEKKVADNAHELVECAQDGATDGRPLNASERVKAEALGIKEIDKVRVVTGTGWWKRSPLWWVTGTMGYTCGYTMYFSPIGVLTVFDHELFHIKQMERYDTMLEWYVEYFTATELTGYTMNPFEREANGWDVDPSELKL